MSHEPSHSTEHMSPPPAQAEETHRLVRRDRRRRRAPPSCSRSRPLVVWRIWTRARRSLQPGGPAVVPGRARPGGGGHRRSGALRRHPRRSQVYRNERIERLSSWGGWTASRAPSTCRSIDAMDLVVAAVPEGAEEVIAALLDRSASLAALPRPPAPTAQDARGGRRRAARPARAADASFMDSRSQPGAAARLPGGARQAGGAHAHLFRLPDALQPGAARA